MELNRQVVHLTTIDAADEEDSTVTAEAGIESVWPITVEIWSIATKGSIDAESRLQRNVVSITKAQG
jgi:hypothetical protein